jgi:hypothetical protein
MEKNQHEGELLRNESDEIRELKEQVAHNKVEKDLAEEIVQREEADIEQLEKKIEALEHPQVVLIVNAEPKDWAKPKISYKEVVILAFGTYNEQDGAEYSVDYSKGPEGHEQGILDKGESVPVKNKMRFRVTPTNRS